MKTRMSNRDQVIGAITTRARPMTLYEVYESCDCFTDQNEAAMLLREMEKARAITSFRPAGERARYGTPTMIYLPTAAPAPLPAPPRVARGAPPNTAERETARQLAPVVVDAPASTAKRGRVPVGPSAVLAILADADKPMGMAQLRQLSKYSKSYLQRIVEVFVGDGKVVSFGSNRDTAYAIPDSKAHLSALAAEPVPSSRRPAFISEQTLPSAHASVSRATATSPSTTEATFPLPLETLIERDAQSHTDATDDDLAETFDVLRDCLPTCQFKGFLLGNMILLSMRGTADDMSRVRAYSKALAGVV